MRIWLVGMMGSGKSTVGRRAAEILGLDFADTDTMVEERSGRPIPSIWENDGEEAFRSLEEAAIAEVAESDGVVVATGGGSVLSEANRRKMASNGVVIWLEVGADVLASRASSGDRPLISVGEPVVDQLSHLIDQRGALYEELADHVVDAQIGSVDDVTAEVVRLCSL